MLFLATTAEKSGWLGAAWYARHPLYPLAKTVANISIDGINPFGPSGSVPITGEGHSNLDGMLLEALKAQGRSQAPEYRPEHGHFFRADQFEFARAGVPGLYINTGTDYLGRAQGWGLEQLDGYVAPSGRPTPRASAG